ncbi:tail fiber assembly protein [Escherichia coli]|uniref:tail fiber assembly protein n=1 Tax=Escherichia coli TaxID=562 RepID=UPI00183806F4|nr:tail fiber assembly protein [Escherichia coli]EFH1083615.1 tail fiber assembly protein [Escherichia coli]EFH1545715.1 tail fiber assembly protein [Escherichia coli]UWU03340.1 tail fiber assembly protein [Escherichia coli]
MKYYSPSINGFPEQQTDDSIEISEEVWRILLSEIYSGRELFNDGGVPATRVPQPTQEQVIAAAENERQRLLNYADTVMLDWRTELMLGEISDANRAKLSAWLAYKNKVKSVDVTTDPEHVNWPIPPEV